MTTKKKQNINHWLQTFGKSSGHKVLKEIRDYAEFPDVNSTDIAYGKRQMMEFILTRLKAAAVKKETYASIIYEVELL